jgi:RNA polymerase sigma-70 factor, ECF subfamily
MTSSDVRVPGSSDEELIADYVEGRRRHEAFAELVDRYERRIYAVCYRYFGNAADAEDATQEVFLRIARRAETFTGGSKLSTWVYRVAVNTCHDLARRRKRRRESLLSDVVEAVDAAAQHDSLGWDPGDPAVGREAADAVQRALQQLDEVSRTLLVLVAVEGLSYGEAAAALDVPVGTAKSRVHRARARLAEILHGDVSLTGNPDGPASAAQNPDRPAAVAGNPDDPASVRHHGEGPGKDGRGER